ncbi:MAG: 50S ribosomal protein L9 [Lachnospiraceae bacterium]|nr:50S ribosomal protein L9 [Lachnospiraceae bacterium]MBR3683384.1 50S ribosomal protein L9 [Lachnospiraceae bacterium]
MKVILLEDVKSLGKKGQIVDINDGYARNFVLPKKLGVEATNANLNNLKLQKANEEKVAKEIYEKALAFKEEIEAIEVVVAIKAGEGGRTFGSVSSKEIASEALKQKNIELDKKKIQLAEPIKSFGVHNVTVKLHPKVTATLKVKVQEANK